MAERRHRRLDRLVRPQTSNTVSQEKTGKSARPTGFTRVRARSQGVCVSPRLAAAEKPAALTAPGVVTSRSALSRGGRRHSCEPSLSFDTSPCSTLPTLLIGPMRLCDPQSPQPNRRTPLASLFASSTTRLAANGEAENAARADGPQQSCRRFDGHARPSLAFEQVATQRTATTPTNATSSRTRRTQRVLHEKRNARQCPAAGREPHRHH